MIHWKTIILFLSFLSFGIGEIIYESGDLLEFIGGTSSTTAYDNYVSHISEGIVDPGYNDYGPEWLDVQDNEFGNYRIIPSNSDALDHWQDIFTALLRGNIEVADQMLSDSSSTFYYDLIEFNDTTYNRTYYMLREQLDYSYVDHGQSGVDGDTVIGSFRNGWGLYILNPEASRQQVVVEMPHPCDDFISPYVGTNLFRETDGLAMMMAGAGREVRWTGEGNYSNNKSLSDPSRNANSVFEIYHEVLTDSLVQIGPHSPIVFHIHSFDDNEAHEGFRSVVVSAGWDAGYVNKPIRDVTDENLDIINFTSEIVHPANTFGPHADLDVTDFYQVHYSGTFLYHGAEQNYSIPHTYVLLGPYTGVQMNYLRQYFDHNSVYEPWVQYEMHEKPVVFDEMEVPLTELYAGDYPTSYHNFSILIDYYRPLIQATQAYLDNWDNVPDMTPPPQISDIHSIYDGYHYVTLEWDPVEDTNFRTYRIYYDQDEVTEESHYWDIDNDNNLLDMRETETTITGLENMGDYFFKIRGIDHFNNMGPLSEATTDFIPGHDPHVILEDFDDGEVDLLSWQDQDEEPNDWSLDSNYTFMESNFSLKLYGNTWKVDEIEPYPVSDGDVWQVASYTNYEGEIHGFGVQDSANTLFYSFDGSQQLDIEEWVTVYQGYMPIRNWNIYQLPIADDWLAWFDYLPTLTSLVFVNDADNDNLSQVFFDEVVDVTPVLPISPSVTIEYTVGALYRNREGIRNVDVQFTSSVDDPDSDNHTFMWNFGDGETSTEPNPSHSFVVEDDHPYTVLLQVQDESGHWGYSTVQIVVDPGESTYPITLNFVGDIILARGYENNNGIIETDGVESIFEAMNPYLGEVADVTIANLECPLTINGEEHPTKSVTFKGHPDNVAGLVFAGIDIVTLANNHSVDYGLVGLQNTQNVLTENGIFSSGAGENSYEAYLPLYYDVKGVNLAFLANCDRTGQYNNAQPYLNAGVNKDGFAYMTPYYLQEQIEDVQGTADLIIMEMHAGSEYSTQPGAGYDAFFDNGWDNLYDIEAPREITDMFDIPDISDEDENYSPRLDVPHVWDRAIRHFAVDSGADLVIIHHPHIIQGLEVYNGTLIAHSLGNFVFDLSYHETFPSMILDAEIDENGFSAFSVTPVYIDDWIPVLAQGGLGTHLLDYLAMKSRELDSYFYVDRENVLGHVVLDTLNVPRIEVAHRNVLPLVYSSNHWASPTVHIHQNGNISAIDEILLPGTWEYRVGRDLLWYGNMEDEGNTQWNDNSNDEWFDTEVAYEGERSITHRRTPTSGDNIITNLENRIKIDSDNLHSIAGYIRTQNGDDVTIQIRYYTSRTSSTILATHYLGVYIDGDSEWTFYENETNPPNNANFFDIRLNSDQPSVGEARSWFDNVSVIEWSDWLLVSEADTVLNPNDYYFLQVRTSTPMFEVEVNHTETIYADVPAVIPDFIASEYTAIAPAEIAFTNTSVGYTGWFEWNFGDGSTSIEENPIHLYENYGAFEVSLSVKDYDGNVITETRPEFIQIIPEFLPGDVNFDGALNIQDIIIVVNIITGSLPDPNQNQLDAADMNQDDIVNVLDVIALVNVIING